jgi:colicin import membrane protein
MEHAASPSLISLGLPTGTSSEESSFRWGLVLSCALHALIIIMSMFIRFQSESERPLRTIDVALISLPTIPTTTPRTTPSPTKKAAAAQKKVSPPPAAPPVEETLAPLPTETASERLSESLGGAINSILIPQKREPNPSIIPSQKPELHPTQDQSPLVDTLHLPSAPPTITRPKRLQPPEPMKATSAPEPPKVSVPKKMPAPMKSQPSPPSTPTIQPSVKPAPTIPSLSEVTPFTRPEPNSAPHKSRESSSIEESLKRTIPNIQTSPSKPTIPDLSKKRPATRVAPIPDRPKAQASVPAQPKMSDTVKKLMEGLKSTRRTPAPSLPKPSAAITTPFTPPPSAIEQQIAKLSIPEVTPVESIKQRLQLLEVQSTGSPNGSTAKLSPGKNRYLAMVEDRIDSHWVAPPLLASNPVVVVKFHISRSGEISQIHITEGSGHAHYDFSAQRAVQTVNPLPPFPADISDSFFDVTYRFIKD